MTKMLSTYFNLSSCLLILSSNTYLTNISMHMLANAGNSHNRHTTLCVVIVPDQLDSKASSAFHQYARIMQYAILTGSWSFLLLFTVRISGMLLLLTLLCRCIRSKFNFSINSVKIFYNIHLLQFTLCLTFWVCNNSC